MSSLVPMSRSRKNLIASLLLTLGMAAFCLNDVCMKSLLAKRPMLEVLCLRSLISSLFVIVLIYMRGEQGGLPAILGARVLGRGVLDFITSILFFSAVVTMPLANVTAIQQLVPLIMALYAALVWGERLAPMRVGAVSLGFCGALLIAFAGAGEDASFVATVGTGRAVLAFAAAILVAARDLIARGINNAVSPLIATLGALVVATLLAGLFMGTGSLELFSPLEFAKLALAGLCFACAHVCVVTALRMGEVSVIAPYYYTQTGFSFLFAILFFGELPAVLAIFGIALVVVAGLVNVAFERRRGRAVSREGVAA